MATSIPRDCIIMTTWTFSAEPLTTLWLHLFSCSAALSLGLIIIRIILFLPSFLCPYCKFIPKLCQKYRSPFKTSEHNHHQFHFFFLGDILPESNLPAGLVTSYGCCPIIVSITTWTCLGGDPVLPTAVKSVPLSETLVIQPALPSSHPPLFVNQQLLECVAVKMQPRSLVFWFTNYFISLFKSQKSVFPFYKQKNQRWEHINILCKIPEGKFQSHF